MLSVIKTLRAIFEKCARGEPLTAKEAAWLAAAFAAYLEHRCRSMDEAFGLRWPKGGVPWWLEEGIRERNAALAELGERHFGALSTSGRSKGIARLSRRYAAANWPHDALRPEMPARYRGTPRAYLWRAFKSGAPMPLCERQMRNILAPARPAMATPGAPAEPRPQAQ